MCRVDHAFMNATRPRWNPKLPKLSTFISSKHEARVSSPDANELDCFGCKQAGSHASVIRFAASSSVM